MLNQTVYVLAINLSEFITVLEVPVKIEENGSKV